MQMIEASAPEIGEFFDNLFAARGQRHCDFVALLASVGGIIKYASLPPHSEHDRVFRTLGEQASRLVFDAADGVGVDIIALAADTKAFMGVLDSIGNRMAANDLSMMVPGGTA